MDSGRDLNPRVQRLTKLLDSILYGRSTISPQNGNLFLEAICAQPDAAACISKLIGSKAGLSSVQAAMRHDLSVGFLNGSAAAFIGYLQAPDLPAIGGGSLLQRVIDAVVEPPIFWTAFSQAFQAGSLQEKAQLSFGWLLMQLILLPAEKAGPYREIAQDPAVLDRLLSSSHPETSTIGRKIKDILSTLHASVSLDDNYVPGGRHDNDFADFRSISIIPTAEEIVSNDRPFLRPASFLDDADPDDGLVATYLDNQFRLLREDMIYEMREELPIALGKKKGKHRGLHIDGLELIGVQCGTESRRSKWAICLQCKQDLPQMRGKGPVPGRKAYLTGEGRNILRNESLTCLIVDGEVVAFPTVRRDEDLIAQVPPIIPLCLTGKASTQKALLKLKHAKHIRLIQIDTALFSYEPVLNALQEMTSVPLSTELLSWKSSSNMQPPLSLPITVVEALRRQPDVDLRTLLNIAKAKPIKLDESQSASLLAALTQRVSLIQGPPGTGKSFIGALLGKILHDSTSHVILVVCYTNHALDQFLEDLLDIGIPESSMVRLGSKSTSRTAAMALQTLQRSPRLFKMGKPDWDAVNLLKSTSEKLVKHIDDTFTKYSSPSPHYHDLLDYLEFEHPEYREAFRVPTSDDGMTRIGRNGRAVNPYYLVNQWTQGRNAGMFSSAPHVQNAADIWKMPENLRRAQYTSWKKDILGEQVLDIYEAALRYNNGLDMLERSFNRNVAAILASKRIIGCTTTAAAKYREDIQAASPGVLLVEEAGEILEAHTLTALGASTKQLILIGDHQQLRPKVNNYSLTVEKGNGFDLNRSLFERLVLKDYPHTTLSQQHRMRPEISALVRNLTYPALVDAPETATRTNVRGLQDNVIFLNHDHPEDEGPESKDSRELYTSSSKRNTYEAEMVLKIVRYIAQQGYGTDKVVILTPYLGQLQLLQSTLKSENDPVLNDLDSYDLVRAGLLPEASAKLLKKPIRLATIDNYQGEESDIVICSLTRSNANHDIGFMSSPERLNVLLSRARNALIMIGNADTFLNARKGSEIWTQLFDLLKGGKHVFDGLPVRCQRHPDRVACLAKPVDFDNLVPDGGCQEPCGSKLSCNVHLCPSKCHQLHDHSKMPCEKVLTDLCANGHALSWMCHQGRPAVCRKCEKEAKLADEKLQRDFAEKQKREADELDHARTLAKLNEEIEKHNQARRDTQLAEERAAAIRQKEQDLKDAASAKGQPKSPTTAPITSASGNPAPGPSASSSASFSPPSNTGSPGLPQKTERKEAQAAPTTATSTCIPPVTSASEQEWERQKVMEGASSAAIDAIMGMTGLEDVKEKVLNIKARIDVANRQSTSSKGQRYNTVLLGNPGTGKTTVARHYAKFLTSVNVIPGSEFVETSGSSIANDGVNGAKKLIEQIVKAGGGALFVDEAYQLTGAHNFQGTQVLDFLLAEMENRVEHVVFILAGYSKQMEKFFEHNPGLSSRVPYELRFADYTDTELGVMLERIVRKKYNGRMKFEDGPYGLYSRIAIRRLGRGRGREGFGNARALENLLAQIMERQAVRLTQQRKEGLRPDDFLLSKEDLIGSEPSQVLVENAAWKKLQSLIGLTAVKESIRNLLDLIDVNYQRELKEKDPVQMSLNRVFLGSPGTGKTTVANLYGQILASLGLLSNGEVVMKNPADFIGAALGESETKTKAILAATIGKVLIIDEAYMLYGGATGMGKQGDPYKTAVIDTIVAEVQSVPGEDRCVLLLGYKEQIVDMFQNVNPGLSRRFAIENAFHFEDFSDSELLQILDWKLKDQDLGATDAAKAVAIEVLSRARNRPNFGNAGEVENILGQAKTRYQTRQASLPPKERSFDIIFEPQDFDPNYDRSVKASANLDLLFQDVIGCEEIVEKLRGYQQTARKMKARGMIIQDLIPTNFVMKGPPGTGKTTTARKMGQVYYDMGFLSTAEVVECSASDLVGQYVGQTGPKTKALLEKALGRVLFVDEAYRLGDDGPFAKEAIDELVSILTQPRFLHKVVVILAGYDQDMNQLMAINSGLSSRFSEELIFKNMSPSHCLAVLKSGLSKKKVRLLALDDHLCKEYRIFVALLEQLSALPSWGNARDIGTLAKHMISHVYTKLPDDGGGSGELILASEDAANCMKLMLSERQERNMNLPSTLRGHLQQNLQQMPNAPPHAVTTRTTQNARPASPVRKSKLISQSPVDEQDAERDAGVTDSVWEQLQKDKLAAQLAEQNAKDIERKLERETQEARKREEAERAMVKRLEEERARDAAAENERKRKLEAARLRECEARAKREREEAAFRAAREEEARRAQQEAKAQAALRQMGVCVAGYRWIKQSSGYRCSAGGHFVGNEALGI